MKKKECKRNLTIKHFRILAASVMLIYFALHIKPIKDPHGDKFLIYNMSSIFGIFLTRGEGFVLFPHTIETLYGPVKLKPFGWIDYKRKNTFSSIDGSRIGGDITLLGEPIPRIYSYWSPMSEEERTSYKPELPYEEAESDSLSPYEPYLREDRPLMIDGKELLTGGFASSTYGGSGEFNHWRVSIGGGIYTNQDIPVDVSLQDGTVLTYTTAAGLLIRNDFSEYQLSSTLIYEPDLLIKGLTDEPILCETAWIRSPWDHVFQFKARLDSYEAIFPWLPENITIALNPHVYEQTDGSEKRAYYITRISENGQWNIELYRQKKFTIRFTDTEGKTRECESLFFKCDWPEWGEPYQVVTTDGNIIEL